MDSFYLNLLKNRITLDTIPFTDRGARMMLFREGQDHLWIGIPEFETKVRQNPPVRALYFTDENGSALALEATTYPHRCDFQTPRGIITAAFADEETLLFALPPGKIGVTFQARADEINLDGRGGRIKLAESAYHLTYTLSSDLVHNDFDRLENGVQEFQLQCDSSEGVVLLLNLTPSRTFNRYIPEVGAVIDAAARRWHEWFAAAPTVAERYQRQYYYAWWIMGINLLRPYFHPQREGMIPSRLGYVGIWLWDAYFHAIAYRHVDKKLAQDQFRIMLDFQLENGMIPDVIHDRGLVTHSTNTLQADRTAEAIPITKPPLTAWAAWKLYEIDHDAEFLREIYDAIVRSHQWWFSESDLDHNGLCEYLHRYSSGLDDNPLWDHGMPIETPDLSAYLCLQADYLAKIAEVIGRTKDVPEWQTKAEQLAQHLVDLRWDAEAGYFWAAKDGKRLPSLTPFNLYPLISGRTPADIAQRLVATLTDERHFWSRYPVPTVALSDPAFDPLKMWRGPVWINPNYVLIDGLERAGFPDVARELRHRTLELILQRDDIYEYYHPETGEKPPAAAPMFGWSAALFIDLAITASSEASTARGG